MFSFSQTAWAANVAEVKARGMGDFEIAPSGEYTLYMRPGAGTGLLIVTPSYSVSDESAPWKLSVSVAADEEPAFSFYLLMSPVDVESLIKKAAHELAPEYSVLAYMVRSSKFVPTIHFTIFQAGDFPSIDEMNEMGQVCPSSGGEQACVRSSMIE